MAQCHRRWFRAPARCRPEASAPGRPRAFSRLARGVSRPLAAMAAGLARGVSRPLAARPAFLAVPALFHGWRGEFRGLWPRCRSEDRRSWPSPRFFTVGEGSFAAFGRDAGLKTGAPGRPRAFSRWARGVSRPWPRCRSEDRRSWPSPRFFTVGEGSFAACGRDAGLKTGAPGRPRAFSRLARGVSRPLAAMPV